MTETALTPEQILEAAEDVLRRFGPGKTTVVDIARALGVSHGSVYRHFPSKAALREAVAERWLSRISDDLESIVLEAGSASKRLRNWLDQLISTKQTLALNDPELFANYMELTGDAREVVLKHVDTLVNQLARILQDGIDQGEFVSIDPLKTGRAIFDATSRFHKPTQASDWADPTIGEAFENVWQLLLRGLCLSI